MPTARRPVATPRDRAERHVFKRLGELGAVERRVLALLELCEVDVAEVAAEVGIGGEELSIVVARGRKALRRTVRPLASGARCERAELLLAGVPGRPERKWLDIHLARCPRCEEHVAMLERALEGLRASFAAAPVALLPPAAEPPLLEGGEGAGRLRLVPVLPAEVEPPAAAEPEPEPAAAAEASIAIKRPALQSHTDYRTGRLAKRVAVVLVVLAVLAGIVAGVAAVAGGDEQQSAPWSAPNAPVVQPHPLSAQ